MYQEIKRLLYRTKKGLFPNYFRLKTADKNPALEPKLSNPDASIRASITPMIDVGTGTVHYGTVIAIRARASVYT